jgi:hypothetical protein
MIQGRRKDLPVSACARCTFAGLLGGPAACTREPPASPSGGKAAMRGQRSCGPACLGISLRRG